MFRFGSALLFASCLTLVSLYSTAQAQPAKGSGAPPGYDAMIDAALDEFEAGNFAEARSQFLKAHGIFPNARTFRALGKTDYELKNYLQASVYLEQALASKVKPLTADQRAETQRLLDSARGYLGRYVVSLTPSSARLLLDGSLVSLNEKSQLVLPVGDHVLEAQAAGYISERRPLRVIGGGSESLVFDLRPVPVEPPPAPALPAVSEPEPSASPLGPPQSETTPLRKKWWLWTGVVGVIAGGAVAGVLLALRKPDPRDPSGGSTGVDVPFGTN